MISPSTGRAYFFSRFSTIPNQGILGLSPKDGGKGESLLTTHYDYPQPVIRKILKPIRTALDHFHLSFKTVFIGVSDPFEVLNCDTNASRLKAQKYSHDYREPKSCTSFSISTIWKTVSSPPS